MIVDLNITEYIRSLMKEEKNDLSHIESEARVNHVPIVKPETKELLRTLVLLKKPMKILEVGAAVGFSSLYMNSYQPEGGTIITIERNEKRIKKAKENIKNQGKEEQITLLEGDAIEILKGLDGSFDLIFVDAAKGQYIHFLPEVLRLLKKGGLLVSDNVLQDGDIIEIDIPNRSINVKLSDEELNARREAEIARGKDAFKPKDRNRVVSKALRAYASMVSSADKGAVRMID
jgi:predicted O-methyltransferase YrrM